MIGVIILNYNNLEDTINCIKSIEQYNTAEIKIVVVDNGSCDDSADTLNSYFTEKYNMKYTLYVDNGSQSILPYITLVETGENLGYARGNNVGLQIVEKDSSVDKILVLNEGKCVGMGTHQELMKNCPVYQQIALSQLTEKELNV